LIDTLLGAMRVAHFDVDDTPAFSMFDDLGMGQTARNPEAQLGKSPPVAVIVDPIVKTAKGSKIKSHPLFLSEQ